MPDFKYTSRVYENSSALAHNSRLVGHSMRTHVRESPTYRHHLLLMSIGLFLLISCGTTNDPAQTGDVDSGQDPVDIDASPISENIELSAIISKQQYDMLFLNREDSSCEGDLFSYEAFLEAASTFPNFSNDGDLDVRTREVAAFLANISHETTGGWATAPGGPQSWGLCFKEEVGCGNGSCNGYCSPSSSYPCEAGKTYHGRGPMQLSWNYNYGQAGEALGLDLLSDPDLVTSSGVVAFRTALWFWMTPQSPKPSCHDVISGLWTPSSEDTSVGRVPGFGMTINIINGGLECNRPTDGRVVDRVAFFEKYTDVLGTTTGAALYCDQMQSY